MMSDFLDNPYLREFERVQADRDRQDQSRCSDELRRKYAYAVPTEEAIRTLADLSPIVEIGAGTGYWAWMLSQAGADVLPYNDPAERSLYWRHHEMKEWVKVKPGGPEVAAVHPGRCLFLCWPDWFPGASEEDDGCLAGRSLR